MDFDLPSRDLDHEFAPQLSSRSNSTFGFSLHYSYNSLSGDYVIEKKLKEKKMEKCHLLFLGLTANNNGKLQPKELGARDERVHISLGVQYFALSFCSSVFLGLNKNLLFA